MNAPGKSLLNVVSVLYIIFGGLWALLAIVALAASTWVSSMLGMFGALGFMGGAVIFIVLLIVAAVDLVVGIIGVKQCGDPSKAMFFIVFGIILSVLALISMTGSFFSGLIGLVMPVLLIVGGFMNKNAADTPLA